jgi:two-component system KDP operon response regulator KdpE
MTDKKSLKRRVLIVDDDPGICKALSISLRLSGFEVLTTTSGAAAINLVRTKKPDIVLLDVVMDDVTGLEVLEQVRSFSQVPVIMFTGRAEIAAIATQLGANDFVVKPFDPDLLLEKIRLSLGARRTA